MHGLNNSQYDGPSPGAGGFGVYGLSATGFTVQADATSARAKGQKDADLTGQFSWRVVAKRKDIEAKRLAPVTFPPKPTLPDFPTAATG